MAAYLVRRYTQSKEIQIKTKTFLLPATLCSINLKNIFDVFNFQYTIKVVKPLKWHFKRKFKEQPFQKLNPQQFIVKFKVNQLKQFWKLTLSMQTFFFQTPN